MNNLNVRNSQLQKVADELKKQNKAISPAILRKTIYHVTQMRDGSYEYGSSAYPLLLYAESQAYMDGFSAAVDGDYNVENTEINPIVSDLFNTDESLSRFGDILPSYMLSRASHYSAVSSVSQPKDVENIFGVAIPTVTATGFILGFSQAIEDLNRGVRFKPATQQRTSEYFDNVASTSVESVINEGENKTVKKFVATCMRDLSERKISTKSGRSRFHPDTEEMCLSVYGIGVVQGALSAKRRNTQSVECVTTLPNELRCVSEELKAWCSINEYDDCVFNKAQESSLLMLEQLAMDEGREGMFLLNGWGFSDGFDALVRTAC